MPSITTTSAAVPSSAASSNGAATSGTGAAQPADESQERLRLVMATLVVVGLIIGLLTWRYWRYSDPKRGLAPSRARLPVLRPQPAAEALEPTTASPSLDATVLDEPALAEASMLVPSVAASGAAWSPTAPDDAVAPGSGHASYDQTVVASEDPTDPGGWTLPDREPVGSD